MPAIWRTRSALALVALLALAPASAARAGVDTGVSHADPLQVPTGPLPEPENSAGKPAAERVANAADALRDRGFDELPILAWALLESAQSERRPELVARAVELAPDSPGVLFEAARISNDPHAYVSALAALAKSLPGVLYALGFAGVLLGGGALALALGVSAFAALRGFGLHGHAFGHSVASKDPPGWTGVLLLLAALGALPLFGVGPLALAGLFGGFGALRLRRAEAACTAIALTVAGFALGPGLDRLAPALTAVGRAPELIAAWRIDRGQSLPGDFNRVESASKRHPDDALLHLALATAWMRRGDLARAETALGTPGDDADPAIVAAQLNLRGIVRLAQGDIAQAIPAFERARSTAESAPVVFNLSQAYGRALRLSDQQPTFEAASRLDADLVSKYMSNEGANVHRTLIESSLPLALYAARALAPSEESRTLASELRARLLGSFQGERAWWILPAAGIAGFALRRKSVARCSRCDQPICARCSREARSAGTCMRCVRLFIKRENTDPRLRKLELARDRSRQRRAVLAQAVAALAAPGAVDLLDERLWRGSLRLFALGAGLAALYAPALLPVPWDLGTLGFALPVCTALALLAPTALFALVQTAGRLAQLRRRGAE